MTNYYVELGLDRAASISELETELKALRKKWTSRASTATSTDKRQKAEKMVDLVREATETLLNEEKKAKYDKQLDKKGGKNQNAPAAQNDYYAPQTNAMDDAALLDALESFYENGKYNQAISAANRLISNGTADVDVYRYLTLCYAEKGNDSKAYQALMDLNAAFPDDPDALVFIASILLRVLAGREKEARPYLDRLIQAGYGDSSEVAALDIEYQIDTGNTTLADQKTNEYLSKNGSDNNFRTRVANAYVQSADQYLVEVGGDCYVNSEADFKSFSALIEKAASICPSSDNAEYLKTIKDMKKGKFIPDTWIGLLCCVCYAFAGFATEMPLLGVVAIAFGIVLGYFSYVPTWMYGRFYYKKHLCGMYEVFRYINIIISLWWRIGWAIFKFILGIFFAFI